MDDVVKMSVVLRTFEHIITICGQKTEADSITEYPDSLHKMLFLFEFECVDCVVCFRLSFCLK